MSVAGKPTIGAVVSLNLPRSTNRYSALIERLLVSACSTPPPTVQPPRFALVVTLLMSVPPTAPNVSVVFTVPQAPPPVAYSQVRSNVTPMRPRNVTRVSALLELATKSPGANPAAISGETVREDLPVRPCASASTPKTTFEVCQL